MAHLRPATLKSSSWRGFSLLQGAQRLSRLPAGPFPLGKQTQGRADGRRARSLLWSSAFFLAGFSYPISYVFPTHYQTGRRQSRAGHLPAHVHHQSLCCAHFSVLRVSVTISLFQLGNKIVLQLLNCTLAPSGIGIKENNSSSTPTAAAAESPKVWGERGNTFLSGKYSDFSEGFVRPGKSKPTS